MKCDCQGQQGSCWAWFLQVQATCFVAAETEVLHALQPGMRFPPLFPDPGGWPQASVGLVQGLFPPGAQLPWH